MRGDPRILKLAGNTFEIVATIENPNIDGEIYRAGYTFKLYDASSIAPVHVLEGETFVPKGARFAIFEGPFNLEEGIVPTRATLEWKETTLVWKKNSLPTPELRVEDLSLSREDTSPRLDAVIENLSLSNVLNVDVVAFIYDGSGNVIAASKTLVDKISARGKAPVVFTWPRPFEGRKDICSNVVDVVLVIDRSGSMSFLGSNPPQPLTDVKNLAAQFVTLLTKNDRYALISFANEPSVPIDAQLGVSLETIQHAINKISIHATTSQNTNIGASILSAMEELNSSRHRREVDKVMVLLTDGVPTLPTIKGDDDYPVRYTLESARLARNDGVSIYAIGLGKDVDKGLLGQLATTTSEAYFAPSTKELGGIYKQISTKLCGRSIAEIDLYLRVYPDTSFVR